MVMHLDTTVGLIHQNLNICGEVEILVLLVSLAFLLFDTLLKKH